MEGCVNDIYDIYVEQILDTKTSFQNGEEIPYFMVQWKCTWESEKSLKKYCTPLLEKFWQKREEERKKLLTYTSDEMKVQKGKEKDVKETDKKREENNNFFIEEVSRNVKCTVQQDNVSSQDSNDQDETTDNEEDYDTTCTEEIDTNSFFQSENNDLQNEVGFEVSPQEEINTAEYSVTELNLFSNTTKEENNNSTLNKTKINPTVTLTDITLKIPNIPISYFESDQSSACESDYALKTSVNKKKKTNLQSHFNKYCNELPYKCEKCSFATRFYGNLKKHLRTRVCRRNARMKATNSPKKIRKTKNDAHEKLIVKMLKLFKCRTCSFASNHRKDFRRHCETHKSIKQELLFQCENCEFSTDHKSSLKRHTVSQHKSHNSLLINKSHKETPERNIEKKKRILCNTKSSFSSIASGELAKCTYCDFQTKYPFSLVRHIERNHSKMIDNSDQVRFQCQYCDKAFSFKSNCIRHAKSHKNTYTCQKCNFVSTSHKLFISHKARHKRAIEQKCIVKVKKLSEKLCNAATIKKRKTSSYIKNKSIKKPIFRASKEKVRLARSFSKSKIFQCQFCQYKTRRIHLYKWHTKYHHINKLNSSKEKDKPSSSKVDFHCQSNIDGLIDNSKATVAYLLSIQAAKKHSFACQYCFFKLQTRASLESHLRIHTSEKPFVCGKCKLTFRRKERLVKHLPCDVNVSGLEYVPGITIKKKLNISRLLFADKRMIRNILQADELEIELTKHDVRITSENNISNNLTNSTDSNSQLLTYQCQECTFSTNSEEDFSIHKIIHNVKKIFNCRFCSVVFETKAMRQQHEKTEHNVGDLNNSRNKIQCRYCLFTSSESTIKSHEKTHVIVKPYKCPLCSYRGIRRDYVKVHMTRNHNGITS